MTTGWVNVYEAWYYCAAFGPSPAAQVCSWSCDLFQFAGEDGAMRCAYCAPLASILRPPILSSAVSDSALSRATVGDTAGHGHRLVLIFGNERAIVHALGAVSDHVLRLTVQAVKILSSRIHADMTDRKTLGLD